LYARQQMGQRHSTTISPTLDLLRANRQPNCALMRV
jgi:hypothetical protein